MTYIKNQWRNGDIITAEKLNHLEEGVSEGGLPGPQGPKGDKGDPGPPGPKGDPSSSLEIVDLWSGSIYGTGASATFKDSINNYDFILIETDSCKLATNTHGAKVTMLLPVNDIEIAIDGVPNYLTGMGFLSSSDLRLYLMFKSETELEIQYGLANTSSGSVATVRKVKGIRLASNPSGDIGGGGSGGGENTPTYTDEEIRESIDSILYPTTTEQEVTL